TALGDPVEIAALTQAFGLTTEKRGYCALGSVKTNIGHLDVAAGVVGLIKAALVVEHGLVPPSLHFERANPEIDFPSTPFFVNTRLTPWPSTDVPRRAGVSSFGIGGTNAHVVLEEAEETAKSEERTERRWQVLTLSAKTSTALSTLAGRFAEKVADER